MIPKLYWEDFPPGSKHVAGPRLVSEDEIVDFGKQFDPQYFHTDAEKARQSVFGTVVASGWHICSLAMRMVCDSYLLETAGLASPGVDKIRWKVPVRPGDSLSVESVVVESRRSGRQHDVGIVKWHWSVRNQLGQLVAELETTGRIRCRPADCVAVG